MNLPEKDKKTPDAKAAAPAWGTALGVLVCGAGLWVRFGHGENGVSVACTVLAAAVLAMSLVLSVLSHPQAH